MAHEAEPATPEPARPAGPPDVEVGIRDVAAVVAILALFLAAQALAVFLQEPFEASGVDQAFENPDDPLNGVWLLLFVVGFTVLILWIARRKGEKLIQALILASVGLTLVYVLFPLLDLLPIDVFQSYPVRIGGLVQGVNPAIAPAAALAGLLTWLLYRRPEWYTVNAVGVGVSAGAIAIFGSSFTPVTYLIVLVAFAVYDYVSVYRTKHMLSLADKVLDLHLPIMLVVPKGLDYSFLEETGGTREAADAPQANPKRRDALFIGLGDIVIPSIFAVTALQISAMASFGSFMGISAGLLVLMAFVLKGKPHAGLPTLNTGAFVGFLAGLYYETGSLVFW